MGHTNLSSIWAETTACHHGADMSSPGLESCLCPTLVTKSMRCAATEYTSDGLRGTPSLPPNEASHALPSTEARTASVTAKHPFPKEVFGPPRCQRQWQAQTGFCQVSSRSGPRRTPRQMKDPWTLGRVAVDHFLTTHMHAMHGVHGMETFFFFRLRSDLSK